MNLDDQVWAPDPKVGFKLGVLKVRFDKNDDRESLCQRLTVYRQDIGVNAVTVLIDGKKEKFGYNDIYPSEKNLQVNG